MNSGQNPTIEAAANAVARRRSVKRTLIILTIALAVCTVAYHAMPYETDARKALVLLMFVGILWLTEATDVTITALLVPIGTLLLGIGGLTTAQAFSAFADPIIFLFLGGFALATALHVQKLDRKIAFWIVSLAGSRLGVAALLMFVTTAVLSMFINNTATTAMMLPLAMGILSHMDVRKDRGTAVFILLGIAYSANIGGMGTLVGSAPNGIAARAIGMDFAGWAKVGLPLVAILMPLMMLVLWVAFRPRLSAKVEIPEEKLDWNAKRWATLAVFLVTVVAWTQGPTVSRLLGVSNPDSFFAMLALVSIVLLGIAPWKDVAGKTDWGVLLLFGGGLTLSAIMRSSGASAVLGDLVAGFLATASPFMVVLGLAAFIIVLTEFTSNTASAALLVPIFAAIATQLGMTPVLLVMVIGLGASCAFMLPVATPPNALVFGTGIVQQGDMVRAGVWLNVVSAVVIAAWCFATLR